MLVVSGHDVALFGRIVSGLTPSGVTVVIPMGLRRRAALAGVLLARGWAAATPAAIVAEASLPTQQVWRGSLDDLASGRATLSADGPATIVIGDVAALSCVATQMEMPEADVARALAGGGGPHEV
jgi:siroheme synthase